MGTDVVSRGSRAVRVGWACALSASLAAALASAGACLPDLAALPEEGEDASSPAQAVACGDGIIDTLDDGGDAGESCDPGDAQSAGCERCQFVCSGAIDDAGHCYFMADPTSTISAALSACRAAKAHLVTFSSRREFDFATSFLASHDAGNAAFWVGLYKRSDLNSAYGPPTDLNEPGWPRASNTCPGCFAIGADEAGAFALRAGDAASSEGPDCLVAENGEWLQVPCVETTPPSLYATLCEREPVGERGQLCTGQGVCMTIPSTVGSKRYVLHVVPATADGAAAYCRNNYNGSLVVLETPEEREQLVREIMLNRNGLLAPATVWIGLSLSEGGAWAWDDGVVANGAPRPLPWGSEQPAGAGARRAFLRIGDQFDTQLARSEDDAGADARRPFVCQR